jgi:UDP-N-acetylmuramoylalanine--D-glutamate ligase
MLRPENLLTFGNDPKADFFSDHYQVHKKVGDQTVLEYQLPFLLREKWMIHDCENALAAWLLIRPFGISVDNFLQALTSFSKPAHRIEHVANIRGVSYYDDSKGTNIDAVIKAVGAMKGQVILLAGGVDKGASYKLWKSSFSGKVRQIFAFGEARGKIAQETADFCQVQIVQDLEEAVMKAADLAKEGECILLSPGCSSFDMFHDYAHRGEEFKRCVRNIHKEILT